MTAFVIIIMASLRETKTSNRGFPFFFMKVRVTPNTIENTTTPKMLEFWVGVILKSHDLKSAEKENNF